MERGERGSSIMSTYIGINTKNSGLVQRSISDCLKCCSASVGSCVSGHKPHVNNNQMRERERRNVGAVTSASRWRNEAKMRPRSNKTSGACNNFSTGVIWATAPATETKQCASSDIVAPLAPPFSAHRSLLVLHRARELAGLECPLLPIAHEINSVRRRGVIIDAGMNPVAMCASESPWAT